jgi:hypothetical protein
LARKAEILELGYEAHIYKGHRDYVVKWWLT